MTQSKNSPSQEVVNAISAQPAGMTHAEIASATGLAGKALGNGIYNAKKKGLIAKQGKLFVLPTAAKKPAAKATAVPGEFAARLKKKTAGAYKISEFEIFGKTEATKIKAFLKKQDEKTTESTPHDGIKRELRLVPLVTEIRAIRTLDGGMIVLDGPRVAVELSKPLLNAVLREAVSA